MKSSFVPLADNEVFVGTKRIKLSGKTKAQLEHLHQLMKDDIERYNRQIVNYPPARMEKHGKPFLSRLESFLVKIEEAIKVV